MELNERQLEIVTGSLLGDGFIKKTGTLWTANCVFSKLQSTTNKLGIDKKEYLEWHCSELSPFSSSLTYGKRPGKRHRFKESEFYEYRTKSDSVFTKLESKWYVPVGYHKRRKIVPTDLKLTPLSTCVWFIDDGHNHKKNGNARICTQSFTKEENEFLCYRLKNDIGITAKIQPVKDSYILFIGAHDYIKFIEIIKPYCVWKCYEYKCDLSEYKAPNYTRTKITMGIITEIYELRKRGLTQVEIGDKFNIHRLTIGKILNKKHWLSTKEMQCQT